MNDWTELTDGPIMGRSNQPAHIFLRGDTYLARQRVGVARKILGYAEFDQSIGQLGFTAKVVTLQDGTVIHAICHGTQRTMLIDVRAVAVEEVVPPVHGYQFYTTTPAPQFHQCVETDYFPVGSAVYAPIPQYDPLDPVPANTVELKASPTGSFVETGMGLPHPRYSLGAVIGGTSSCTASLSKLSQAMNAILMVTGSWQVNGVAEYVSYQGVDFYSVLMPNPALYQTWLQGDLPNSLGLKTVLSPGEFTDKYYDTPPKILGPWTSSGPPVLSTKVPDSDWFGRATLRDEVHPVYGRRHFVIMSAADGQFHCWPLNAPLGGDYSAEYTEYGNQSYKGNIVKEYGKSVTPNYPDWVCRSGGAFRDFKTPDEELLTPRSTWSFTRSGDRAISVMIERKTTEGQFKKINYTPDGLGWAVFDALNLDWGTQTVDVADTLPGGSAHYTEPMHTEFKLDPDRTHIPLHGVHVPTEESIDPLQVKPTVASPDYSEIQVDRLGFVELSFEINLTGPELHEFTFAVGVERSAHPDTVNTVDHGALVEVAYARPLAWQGYDALNKMGDKIGSGTGGSIDYIEVDEALCLFIKAYRHNDQTAVLDAYDGEVTLPEPSKVKALFGKGYPGTHTNIITLPLAQIYGRGYTYTEDAEIALPPDPHKFVYRTNQTFASEYPFAPENPGYSEILYTYKAKITDLDLGALSFYYHVRCVGQERKETTILLENGVSSAFGFGENGYWSWHPIEYQARSWCLVSVMGRVVDEVSVGAAAIPLPWLQGWLRSGGALALEKDEEPIDPNERRPFRGFGQQQSSMYPMRAGRTTYNGVPFNEQQKHEHRFVSYHGVLSTESPSTPLISWAFPEAPESYFYLRPGGYFYNHGTMPWFLCGACSALVDFALAILYLETYYLLPSYSYSETEGGGDNILIVSGTSSWAPPSGFSLYTLTEASTKGFMRYVYNLFATFSVNDAAYLYSRLIERDASEAITRIAITTINGSGSLRLSDWLTINPFLSANPSVAAETFAEATYRYFWRMIKYFQAVGPKDSMAPVNPGGGSPPEPLALIKYFFYDYRGPPEFPGYYDEPRCPPHLYVLPRGNGSTTNYNKVYPYVPLLKDLYKNQYFIREFEYGNLVYTHLMHTHFSPVINDGTSFIRVTPEGHFSYCKQDIFEFNRPVTPEAVFYADYIGFTEQVENSFTRTPGIAIPWAIEHVRLPNYLEELTKEDIVWQPVEGVGWYYGALRCSHLDLHRKAYKTPVTTKMYYQDEPVKAEYQDYKPEFNITPAPDLEGYLVNPVMQYDRTAYDWRYWIYSWGQLPHALIAGQEWYPNYNTTRKYIRLSPLFF